MARSTCTIPDIGIPVVPVRFAKSRCPVGLEGHGYGQPDRPGRSHEYAVDGRYMVRRGQTPVYSFEG